MLGVNKIFYLNEPYQPPEKFGGSLDATSDYSGIQSGGEKVDAFVATKGADPEVSL